MGGCFIYLWDCILWEAIMRKFVLGELVLRHLWRLSYENISCGRERDSLMGGSLLRLVVLCLRPKLHKLTTS